MIERVGKGALWASMVLVVVAAVLAVVIHPRWLWAEVVLVPAVVVGVKHTDIMAMQGFFGPAVWIASSSLDEVSTWLSSTGCCGRGPPSSVISAEPMPPRASSRPVNSIMSSGWFPSQPSESIT